ncbi:MAG: hypothetical protein WDO13_07225 [Verrucomicrobiota bacterium]
MASDWMHKGIDLLKENSAATLEQAVRCFDEAIALRRTLPLEDNPLFRYGLSAGWINRGDALARLKGPSLAEAVKSYDEALTLLETLPLEANVLYPRRLAITWINRGMALQSRSAVNDPWEAMECFREALAVLEHPSGGCDGGPGLFTGGSVDQSGGSPYGLAPGRCRGRSSGCTESSRADRVLRANGSRFGRDWPEGPTSPLPPGGEGDRQ